MNIVSNNFKNVIPLFSDKPQYQFLGFCILWSNFVHKRIKKWRNCEENNKNLYFLSKYCWLGGWPWRKKEKALLFKFKLVKLDYCKFV